MGTESVSLVEKNQEENQPVSPGFSSFPTFILRRAEVLDNPLGPVGAENASDLEISSVPTSSEIDGYASIKRSLKCKQRPWIVYDQLQSEREPDVKQHDMVSARWNPAGACSCVLEDAIVFHPDEEDFKDTFKYIDSICQQVEPYGLCRIVPPSSWKVPSFLEEDDIWQNYKLSTQAQRVNELQNHGSYKKISASNDTRKAKRRKLDYEFDDACAANFSSDESHRSESFNVESGPELSLIAFKRHADDFRRIYFSKEVEIASSKVNPTMHQEQWEPSEQIIEGEFWRIVEKPTEEIEVLYGTDSISKNQICKFSVSSNSGQASDSVEGFAPNWDLKNLYKLPGSLLSLETLDSSDILAPQLHIGMCFSCLPWTVEEHRLYKLHYLGMGAPRIWYSIPGFVSHKCESMVKKHFPCVAEEHLELLHRPGRQLSPATLKSEGIPVYRCVQRPGEFVLFLPGAYHSGFDCGFNCSVSAVFAPLNWLPHGQIAIELYRESRRKTSISHDKVLLRAADEAVKAQWESLLRGKKTPKVLTWKEASGKDGVLAKTLRARIRSEARCRDYLSSASQARKMDKTLDDDGRKRECSICSWDLYLSAVSCPCKQNKYSCLVHAKHFCSCAWTQKTFLFRYQINELNILAEAVEGKLSSIRAWVKENLGAALQWNKPNQDQIKPYVEPTSTAIIDKVTSTEIEDSALKLLSEAKNLLKINSEDDLKAKAGETSLKNLSDDGGSSSSSSSDFDIEEYITHLEESYGALPPTI
ncbi:putative lysine-specific demethylase JMJ16 isoform X2 [Beta vulgaris subsp. vulgaris]|uniref:putative lysine-specific demethylase JMJ16 isoform X2 n=1 Tax=Beta vulgaris subsp. vulgaris TaxID=3555 RepID=UPI002037053B|nr:putative lysine-specific demethylase JMJ16 isoform X2 [Beta vulgaris subsp. vulgaris]